MSFYVPLQKFPQRCDECCIYVGNGVCPLLKQKVSLNGEKYANCPLVEVKSPHGEFIDKEVFFGKMGVSDPFDRCDTYRIPNEWDEETFEEALNASKTGIDAEAYFTA